jgi:hypothetical protein
MHYLSLIYFANKPLHVSGMFIAHHQEVFTVYVQTAVRTCYMFKLTGCWLGQDGTFTVYVEQLVRSILTQSAASQLKHITHTNCSTHTVNTS